MGWNQLWWGQQWNVLAKMIKLHLQMESNSDHQDYYMFSRGVPMNLHLPLLLRGGPTQGIVLFLEMMLGTQQKTLFSVKVCRPA